MWLSGWNLEILQEGNVHNRLKLAKAEGHDTSSQRLSDRFIEEAMRSASIVLLFSTIALSVASGAGEFDLFLSVLSADQLRELNFLIFPANLTGRILAAAPPTRPT